LNRDTHIYICVNQYPYSETGTSIDCITLCHDRLEQVVITATQAAKGTFGGEHHQYTSSRLDSRTDTSTFPAVHLEVVTFARTQSRHLHYLVRTSHAATPQCTATNSGTGASYHPSSSHVNFLTDKSADNGSQQQLEEGVGSVAENARDAILQAATEAVQEAEDETMHATTNIQSRNEGSSEPALSEPNAAVAAVQKDLPANEQPFLLQFHPCARPDGMIRHQRSSAVNSCHYQGRTDKLVKRDVTWDR
jgi:hypothetical protein